jgi:[ribosomal protein S18]-alanine N-acetyltransferase
MSVIERMLHRDANGSPDLEIAPMRRRDLKQGVLETELHAYPKPWSAGVFLSEIDQVRSGSRYYLTARQRPGTDRHRRPARSKSGIVGHAGLWFTADEAHITNIAVHPDARRTGVATSLMLALAEEAIRRNCAGWTLEVRVSSTGAQDLYSKFGFVAAGVRQRYYENVEDAVVMWCADIRSDEYAARLESLRGRS